MNLFKWLDDKFTAFCDGYINCKDNRSTPPRVGDVMINSQNRETVEVTYIGTRYIGVQNSERQLLIYSKRKFSKLHRHQI